MRITYHKPYSIRKSEELKGKFGHPALLYPAPVFLVLLGCCRWNGDGENLSCWRAVLWALPKGSRGGSGSCVGCVAGGGGVKCVIPCADSWGEMLR